MSERSGTMIAVGATIRLTTEVEHVDPSTAARLEDEGVADPDRVLTELVEDFAGETRARSTAEALSSRHDERAADAEREPARATSEQRSAMTPTARPSRPSGPGARD